LRNRSISITVTGTGFTAATQIYAGYSPIPTTFDSATQLRCTSFSTTPDSGTLIPIGVVKPGEKLSNTVLFTATDGGVQGFMVMANLAEPPGIFEFGTDETSQHTNLWDFGDGTSAQAPVGEIVLHRYTLAGTYTVTCKCHGVTETTSVDVAANDPHRDVVVAVNGLTAELRVTGGTANRHVYLTWGDGQQSETTLDGTGAGAISHTYAAPGTYRAEARAELTDTTLTEQYDLIVPGNVQTQRVITYGCYLLNFEFLLLTIDYAQIHGEAVSWDFGDGVTADSAVSDVAVAHTFAAPGEYTVRCVFSGGVEQVTINASDVVGGL
jgi:plastocyanin